MLECVQTCALLLQLVPDRDVLFSLHRLIAWWYRLRWNFEFRLNVPVLACTEFHRTVIWNSHHAHQSRPIPKAIPFENHPNLSTNFDSIPWICAIHQFYQEFRCPTQKRQIKMSITHFFNIKPHFQCLKFYMEKRTKVITGRSPKWYVFARMIRQSKLYNWSGNIPFKVPWKWIKIKV